MELWVSIAINAVLVAVTWWYATLTRDISRSADKSAAAAERSAHEAARAARATEHALRIESMPQLFVRWRPGDVVADEVGFYVQNDGRSTALNVTVRFGDSQIGTEAMPAGSRLPNRKAPLSKTPRTVLSDKVIVEYTDVFGKQYRTTNSLSPDEAIYEIEERAIGGWTPIRPLA